VAQCHGTNVGPVGELRRGNGGVTGGVPFVAFDRTQASVSGDVAGPLRACGAQAEGVNDGKADVQCVAVSFRGRDDGISAECEEDVSPSLRSSQGGSDKQFVAYGVSENQRAEVLLTDYSHQITSGGGKPGQGYPCVAFTERTRADGRNLETQDDLAYALTNPGNGGRAQERRVAGAFGVRRLTPTECCRLQGFPDGWNDGQSDTQRYRELGNAVAVPCVYWLARRIVEAAS